MRPFLSSSDASSVRPIAARAGHFTPAIEIPDPLQDAWIGADPDGQSSWRRVGRPACIDSRPDSRPSSLTRFKADQLAGFGLLQRDAAFGSYHDLGARYERRPSAWIEPRGDWGPGNVVLVQLPTTVETNDNIVAFWTPLARPEAGQALPFEWTVSFGGPEPVNDGMARARNTFVGDGSIVGGGNVEGAYRIIIDFSGGPLERRKPSSAVLARVTGLDDSEVLEHFVEHNEAQKSWRLSILARPAKDQSLNLRAFLADGDVALTETWTYRLPPSNDILVER